VHVIHVPDLGEGLAAVEVVAWLVHEGDTVREDQAVVEVESDKATTQIHSPVAGPVGALLVQEGRRAAVGDALVEIAPAGAVPGKAPRALPRVRALAAELGVDLARSHADGRVITERDVLAAAAHVRTPAPERPPARRVPLRGVRREIAEHLTTAAAIPTVTVVEECDFSGLSADITPYAQAGAIVAAAAAALAEHPSVNATLADDELLVYEQCDIGYAVQGPHGLVVPVIRDAGARSPHELTAEVERLVKAARAAALSPAELRGGTFTITNAGRLGGLLATPLLNAPQTAILGIHRIAPRPVVRDGDIVVRPIGMVSCGFDHRALDGAAASAFLLDVIERVEHWSEPAPA
jgi:pyruvate/2-oxoglutarate dehydrogenase complex dihydrolipoamide acyltransferase (E2) component